MLSIGFALIIGGSLGVLLYDIGDKKPTFTDNTYLDSVKYKRKEKLHNLYKKYDNMSDQELDQELKYYDWYGNYGTYCRQLKIEKIIEKMMER